MVDVGLVILAIGGILAVALAVTLYRVLSCTISGSHSHLEPPADIDSSGVDAGPSDDGLIPDGGAEADEEEEESFLATVTPPTPLHNPPEMNAVGWMMALGIAFVLLPLWPFIILLWLVGKFGRTSKEETVKHPAERTI